MIRLPNLPTALADVLLAALALRTQLPAEEISWLSLGLLLASTACLYSAGMVWNDWFDLAQDRRERPGRPLPSGRVSSGEGIALGASLMCVGAVAAALVGVPSLLLALAIIAAVFLYDGALKKTWAGPIGMGLCRFLNVLLGLSLVGRMPMPWGPYLAAVVGLYVIGVTWLARTEARQSSRPALQGAAGVLLASLLLAVPLPVATPLRECSALFPYLLVALGLLLGFPVVEAVRTPSPERVQTAVKSCLLGLIALDAVLATAVAREAGLLLLLLVIPVLLLRRLRWLYAT